MILIERLRELRPESILAFDLETDDRLILPRAANPKGDSQLEALNSDLEEPLS